MLGRSRAYPSVLVYAPSMRRLPDFARHCLEFYPVEGLEPSFGPLRIERLALIKGTTPVEPGSLLPLYAAGWLRRAFLSLAAAFVLLIGPVEPA